jgi:hypothetical protein
VIIVYAILAVLGAVLPMYFNVAYMAAGFSMSTFMDAAFANPAASSFSADLLIGCAAFLAWMITEARKLGMKHWWVYIALTFLIAFAFACPFFLFMRERHLRARKGG